MDDSDIESVEHASLGVLRDLWEVRWGKELVLAHYPSFWFSVGERLFDAGWVSWTTTSGGKAVFRLKEPVT